MRLFRVNAEIGGLELYLTSQQERWYEECKTDEERHKFLAHEAWRRLWEGDAKAMLQKLCDAYGVGYIKHKFEKHVKIEEIKS